MDEEHGRARSLRNLNAGRKDVVEDFIGLRPMFRRGSFRSSFFFLRENEIGIRSSLDSRDIFTVRNFVCRDTSPGMLIRIRNRKIEEYVSFFFYYVVVWLFAIFVIQVQGSVITLRELRTAVYKVYHLPRHLFSNCL